MLNYKLDLRFSFENQADLQGRRLGNLKLIFKIIFLKLKIIEDIF